MIHAPAIILSNFDRNVDRALKNWCLPTRRKFDSSNDVFYSAGNMLNASIHTDVKEMTHNVIYVALIGVARGAGGRVCGLHADREDLFFGLYLIFGRNSASQLVSTIISVVFNLRFGPPPIQNWFPTKVRPPPPPPPPPRSEILNRTVKSLLFLSSPM